MLDAIEHTLAVRKEHILAAEAQMLTWANGGAYAIVDGQPVLELTSVNNMAEFDRFVRENPQWALQPGRHYDTAVLALSRTYEWTDRVGVWTVAQEIKETQRRPSFFRRLLAIGGINV